MYYLLNPGCDYVFLLLLLLVLAWCAWMTERMYAGLNLLYIIIIGVRMVELCVWACVVCVTGGVDWHSGVRTPQTCIQGTFVLTYVYIHVLFADVYTIQKTCFCHSQAMDILYPVYSKHLLSTKPKVGRVTRNQPHTNTPIKATDNVLLPTSEMKASAYLQTGFTHTSKSPTQTHGLTNDYMTDRQRETHRNRYIIMQIDRQTDTLHLRRRFSISFRRESVTLQWRGTE